MIIWRPVTDFHHWNRDETDVIMAKIRDMRTGQVAA
jgi:hypothetical protein